MTRRRSRRIVWLFAAATLIPIGVLSWLGVRILQQDRDAERQRRREALDVSARRLALDLAEWVRDAEARTVRGEGIILSASGPVSTPSQSVLYHSPLITPAILRNAELADAETLEHQKQDLNAAAAAYQRLAVSKSTGVRAAALLALGGVLNKRGDRERAMAAYAELARLGDAEVAGQPAALVARNARCRLLERAGETGRLQSEAADLARLLYAGGWRIDRPTFENYHDSLQRWGASAAPQVSIARTQGAIRLWQSWHAGELEARGSRIIGDAANRMLAIWTGGPDRPVVWLAHPAEFRTTFDTLATAHNLRITGSDDEGRPLFGDGSTAGLSLVRSETQLPFVLGVAPLDEIAADSRDRMRRTVLIASLLMAFVLTIAAAYGLYRTTTRELELARQQTDFVAAVSHEFRTPLTSMRHLTDLLATRQVASDERRAHYYQLLSNETERLNRMVDALLNFGRIEAGGYAWRLEPLDAGDLVERVVADFRHEPGSRRREIVCEIERPLTRAVADAEALSRALWNLLDNAAKYSAPDAPISVSVGRGGTTVQIRVGDRGIGIGPDERDSVFRKFVRGAEAKRAGIGGVGIGLAFVKHVADAHGGSVNLESEPGQGSTFTLAIPLIDSPREERERSERRSAGDPSTSSGST